MAADQNQPALSFEDPFFSELSNLFSEGDGKEYGANESSNENQDNAGQGERGTAHLQRYDHLAAMLREATAIIERKESSHPVLTQTWQALAAFTEPRVGSLGDEFEPLPFTENGIEESSKAVEKMQLPVPKLDPIEELTAMAQNETVDWRTVKEGRENGEEVDSKIEKEMPLVTIGDFINTKLEGISETNSGGNRGSNAESDTRSADKTKGDLNLFMTLRGKVEKEWEIRNDGIASFPSDISPGRLLLQSVQQFVEYLKENEPKEENLEDATMKYKFPQRKRYDWVSLLTIQETTTMHNPNSQASGSDAQPSVLTLKIDI